MNRYSTQGVAMKTVLINDGGFGLVGVAAGSLFRCGKGQRGSRMHLIMHWIGLTASLLGGLTFGNLIGLFPFRDRQDPPIYQPHRRRSEQYRLTPVLRLG